MNIVKEFFRKVNRYKLFRNRTFLKYFFKVNDKRQVKISAFSISISYIYIYIYIYIYVTKITSGTNQIEAPGSEMPSYNYRPLPCRNLVGCYWRCYRCWHPCQSRGNLEAHRWLSSNPLNGLRKENKKTKKQE